MGRDSGRKVSSLFARDLLSSVQQLNCGQPIAANSGLFVFVAKYNKRRNAYGHRIFYRKIEHGIRIIRVLHTAMNWTEILEGDA